MKIWTSLRKCCIHSMVAVFVSSNVAAQTLVVQHESTDTGQPMNLEESRNDAGPMYLAAAIGIVKPKAEAKPEAAAPVEPPPVQDIPQPGVEVVEAPVVEETPQTASKGVSKLAIGAGVGLAAILAAVAGGGGGGSSSTPTHTPTP